MMVMLMVMVMVMLPIIISVMQQKGHPASPSVRQHTPVAHTNRQQSHAHCQFITSDNEIGSLESKPTEGRQPGGGVEGSAAKVSNFLENGGVTWLRPQTKIKLTSTRKSTSSNVRVSSGRKDIVVIRENAAYTPSQPARAAAATLSAVLLPPSTPIHQLLASRNGFCLFALFRKNEDSTPIAMRRDNRSFHLLLECQHRQAAGMASI